MKYSLFIGRYSPLHVGHIAIIQKVLDEGKNVLVAIRNTPISPTDPFTYKERKSMFVKRFGRKVKVIKIPDIEEVCFGRKVGWGIREIKVGPEIEAISATEIRKNL